MRVFIVTFFLALAVFMISPVMAGNDEEKIQHYETMEINSIEHAFNTLTTKNAQIEDVLKKEKLSDSDMEAVHEATYSLEASVDFLRAKQTPDQEKALDALDEAVQAIHASSEQHNEADIRQWFAAIKTATEATKETF